MSGTKRANHLEGTQPLMTNENTMIPMPGTNELSDAENARPLKNNENTVNPMPTESQDICGKKSCTTAETSAMPEPRKSNDVERAGPSTRKEDSTIPESRESAEVVTVKSIKLSEVDKSENLVSPQFPATKAPITDAKAGERMTAPEVIGSEDTYCAPAQVKTDKNNMSRAYESEDTCFVPAPTTSEDDRIDPRIPKPSASEEARAFQALGRPLNRRMSTEEYTRSQGAQVVPQKTTRYCSWGMVKLIWKKRFGKRAKMDESIPIVLRATIPTTRCNGPSQQRTVTALRYVYPETSFDELLILAIQSLREQNTRRVSQLDGLRVPYLVIHDLRQKHFQNKFRVLNRWNYRSGILGWYWRTNSNKMLPLQIEMVLQE
ncbi:MAG: hypothetical protein LQ350_006229 [Teloschistes chrysophthalmus]|nr:MAG: hypothetical protein LQ350_006229 [Niorma chrysophthalma]